ncbi:hypothetical protein FRY97_17660 [Phaeodactylibacter luteus]|uniref:Uncharacterized protein n=1 Tax=Phaeodactylibacter luteus TaxID=1564516 RepID=A0A5C6RIH5_9BACT|nr:hypothetical protein FRY97_17660 [Phaeodactylibacter luteus]
MPFFRMGACPCPMAGAAMLRGSLSARPLALRASGLAFGHPFAALGRCQAKAPFSAKQGLLLSGFGCLPAGFGEPQEVLYGRKEKRPLRAFWPKADEMAIGALQVPRLPLF